MLTPTLSISIYCFSLFILYTEYEQFLYLKKQVSRRGGFSGASPNKNGDDDQEIAALAAITGAIMEEVKKSQIKNKHNIIQIVIYESSV